jgi:hypothetical protein
MYFFCDDNLFRTFAPNFNKDLTMNFVRLIQHIKQRHDALQSYLAKAINVGLTVYLQFLWTLSQRLGTMTMTIQYTQLSKSNKWLIDNNFKIKYNATIKELF